MYPVLASLLAGEKLPFSLLAVESEANDAYRNHWWKQQSYGVLSRPEVISDEDKILIETINAKSIDTQSYPHLLGEDFICKLLEDGGLPLGVELDREAYREVLVQHFYDIASSSAEPIVIFAGGGYGSGKTNTLNYIEENGCLPIARGIVPMGVDNFKVFLPEFDRIRMVGDGRASSVVQKEAQLLAAKLFERLVIGRKSFFWDSSMSNKSETLARLSLLRENGYKLILVAVFTKLEKAIHLAMKRAHATRRFPHPVELPRSHHNFFANFLSYLDFFDIIKVYHNDPDISVSERQDPVLIARKNPDEMELVILSRALFESFVSGQ